MPSAMMRPRNIAPAVVRSKSSGKHVSGTYPQWMRTLEEKYQKLHKKITENTNSKNMKYSQISGRTVHDIRLAQVVAKYRDLSAQQRPTSSKINSNINTRQSETTAGNQTVDTEANEASVNIDENQTSCLDNNNRETSNDRIYNEINLDRGNEHDGAMEAGENASNYSSDLDDDVEESRQDSGPADVNGNNESAKRSNNKCSFVTEMVKAGNDKKNKNLQDDKYNRENLKTAISRTSRKTSKSCPAKIQTQKTVKPTGTTRTPLQRCKSAHRNCKNFTPLSQEGQHAITETIHEMSVTRSVTAIGHSKPDTPEYIPSRSRKCVRSWMTPRASVSSAAAQHDAKEATNDVSKRIQILQDSKLDNCADLDCPESPEPDVNENESCHSLVGSSSPELRRKNSACLPDIQNEPTETYNVKSQLYRLPGIGTYDVPLREVFEITPLGFDSRYTDIGPVLEERESETPPPDIRQKAIDKCSEWLTKYNK